jgi:hypothetical protein
MVALCMQPYISIPPPLLLVQMKIEENQTALLVGYVRTSNAGGALKVSINSGAFNDCQPYTTSDGQQYVSLVISLSALRRVLDGERAVTTLSHLITEELK